MKSIIVLILCISAGLTAAFKYPNFILDEFCDCRPLLRCHSALSKLKSSHAKDPVRHKAFTKYLDIINCGYIRNHPLVCCPQEIPGEVARLVDNKKLWTKLEEPKSIKKLKDAISKAKESSVSPKAFDSADQLHAQSLNGQDQFPDCGRYLWREDSYGNLTMIDEYPWLALLEYETPEDGKKFLCGGALISDQHILTAARCVTTRGNKLTGIILGEYDTDANPECMDDGEGQVPICVDSVKRYDIGSLIIHDKYNDGISHRGMEDDIFTMDGPESINLGPELHDIALIKLKEKVQFTDYIQPICLPLKKPKTRRFKVAGWGRSLVPDNKGFNTKLLTYLTQCRYSESNRREIDQIYDKNEHICAGISSIYRDEKPCIVDSGGPLMAPERKENGVARMTVFGVSYMETTCENRGQPKNLPGIFTNVYNYKDWIVKHMYS